MPTALRTLSRTLLRVVALLLHLGLAAVLALLLALDLSGKLIPERLARDWYRGLLWILNIKVERQGTRGTAAKLLVSNHVSWLDIPVIGAFEPIRFIGKAEVEHWPVAGWLAESAGTFFLRRKHAKVILTRMVPHLSSGGSVCFFPEGTTTEGQTVLHFHTRLFQAAVESQVSVQPVALQYQAEGAALAPFIGKDNLLRHLLRLLPQDGLTVRLTYTAPVVATDRRMLAHLSENAVRQVLGLPVLPVLSSLDVPVGTTLAA
jgi:1-acyl-sn-glycerol-3-phosphate acyltransferase